MQIAQALLDLPEIGQRALAKDPNGSAEDMAALMQSRHPRIRRLVAAHANTPLLALDILAVDPDREVRLNATMELRRRDIESLEWTLALAV